MIICTPSIVLIVFTIIFLVSLIIGFLKTDGDLLVIGFFGTFLVGLVGWIYLGNIVPLQHISRPVSVKIIRTDTSLILTSNDKPIKTITDVAYYKYLGSYTNINIIQNGYVNLYNTTNWQESYDLNLEFDAIHPRQ